MDLAAKSLEGTLQPRRFSQMSDEEVGQALMQVKGVGPWTVDMFLMFDLNRPDVLPVGDLGVRKGFQTLFGLDELPGPEEMRQRAEPWRPYRSVAVWYLWRVAESAGPQPNSRQRGLRTPAGLPLRPGVVRQLPQV